MLNKILDEIQDFEKNSLDRFVKDCDKILELTKATYDLPYPGKFLIELKLLTFLPNLFIHIKTHRQDLMVYEKNRSEFDFRIVFTP